MSGIAERFQQIDWWRIANLGLKAVIILVVLPFILVAVPQLAGASNSFIVLSNSMHDSPAPVLEAGDVVFVYDTPATQIESGDVITYQSGEEQVTTHRVVEVRETEDGIGFRTKGDANEEADNSLVYGGQIIGTVRFYIPMIGRVVAFAGTSTGLIALVIVPSALLILSELANLRGILKESNNEPTLVENSQENK